MVEKFDWGKGWEAFAERLEKVAPEVYATGPLILDPFERIWRDIVPIVGIERDMRIAVDKDGKLQANWIGFLLLNVLVYAAITEARKRAKEDLDKGLNEALVRINDRFKRIEEYIKLPL